MDQDALSFGEGLHGDSFIHFNTQAIPTVQTRNASIDKLEIPDENTAINKIEHRLQTSFEQSTLNSNLSDFENDQSMIKSFTGHIKIDFSDKENIPAQDVSVPLENKKILGVCLKDSPLFMRVNPPFHLPQKPPLNSTNFNSRRSTNGGSESFNLSFVQEKKKLNQSYESDMNNNNNNKFFCQPLAEKHLERNQSQGKLKLDLATPNFLKEISFQDNTSTTLASKDHPFKQNDIPKYPKSTKNSVDRIQNKENKENAKIEPKKLKKREPKKVEVSLPLESGSNCSISNESSRIDKKCQRNSRPSSEREENQQPKQEVSARTEATNNLKDFTFHPNSYSQEGSGTTARNSKSMSRTFEEIFADQNVGTNRTEDRIKIAPTGLEQSKITSKPPQAPNGVQKLKDTSKNQSAIISQEEVQIQSYGIVSSQRESHRDTPASSSIIGETPKTQKDSGPKKNPLQAYFFLKESYSFQPKLESKSKFMKRDEKVDILLYKDAIRRQHKSLEHLAPPTPSQNKTVLNQSNKLLVKKLVREFEDEAGKFFESEKDRKFNFVQMCEFLQRLRFVQEGQNKNSNYYVHEKSLQHMIWSILKGDKFSGVNERNLLVFLLAIMGLDFDTTAYPCLNGPIANSSSNLLQMNSKKEKIIRPNSSLGMNKEGAMHENLTNGLLLDFEKGSVKISHVKKSSISSTSTHRKNKLSLTSDQADQFETSLGISNILAQKLSFQSESVKNMDAGIFADSDSNLAQIMLGTFDSHGNISFTAEEVQKISQTYDVFYFNRLHASRPLSTKAKNLSTTLSFEPEILEHSRQLALNYREKQLQDLEHVMLELNKSPPADRRVTHADLLIYKGMSTKSRLSEQRQKSQEKLLEACTFKPDIKASARTPIRGAQKTAKNYNVDHYNHRGERLYHIAQESKKPKVDRPTREVEFQKQYNQCTFQPNLEKSKRSQSRSKNTSLDVSKDFEKSIERIKKGREYREHVKKVTEIRVQDPNERLGRFKFTLEKEGLSTKRTSISYTKERPDYGQKIKAKPEERQNSKKSFSIFPDFDSKEEYEREFLFKEIERENNEINITEADQPTEIIDKNYVQPVEEKRMSVQKKIDTIPLLFVDVNFGGNQNKRITVYEGDTAEGLAEKFAIENNLDEALKYRLRLLLQSNMAGILSKIEEEMPSTQSEVSRVPPSVGGNNKFR